MQRYFGVVLALLVVGFSAGQARTEPIPEAPTALSKLATQRRDAARKTYEIMWDYYRDNRTAEEVVYRWSLRWLEAERQLSEKEVDQIAACNAHLERMRELDRLVTKQKTARSITIDVTSSVEYYRVEAEFWMLQAKKDGKKDR
jgi:hypothetical protein